MKAGRELDALVAEKVMGIDLRTWPSHEWGPCAYVNADYPEGSHYCSHCDTVWYSTSKEPAVPCESCYIRCYSTSIAAAWEVVEKLGGATLMTPGAFTDEGLGPMNGYDCCFGLGALGSSTESLPHAICIAALRAVA